MKYKLQSTLLSNEDKFISEFMAVYGFEWVAIVVKLLIIQGVKQWQKLSRNDKS
jgi:hypothetical protein